MGKDGEKKSLGQMYYEERKRLLDKQGTWRTWEDLSRAGKGHWEAGAVKRAEGREPAEARFTPEAKRIPFHGRRDDDGR